MSGKIDVFLSRVSHISQFVLVAFAIFGYFYTVRPIYQKELLSEDIAKKEIELNLLRNKLRESEIHLSKNIDKQLKLESDILNLNSQYSKAESKLTSINEKLNQAVNDLTKQKLITKDTLEMNTQNLEDLYWENLSALVATNYIKHAAWLGSNTKHDNELIYKNYKNLYITPYDAINKALHQDYNFISSAKNIPDSLRDDINKKVRQKLNENKSILNVYPDGFYDRVSSAEMKLQGYVHSNDMADVIKLREEERSILNYIYAKNIDSQTIALDFINKLKK